MKTLEIEEFARLKNLPVFAAGTHPSMQGPKTFTSEELDEAVAGTMEVLPELLEAAEKGAYEGENAVYNTQPIPQLLNLAHNKYLPDTMKQLVKDVKATFKKAGDWVQVNLDNVPGEIAHFIAERFPFRSVEILPIFKSKNGKTYRNVFRSIAFLPPDQPPAVAGQTANVAVEYQQQPTESVWTFRFWDVQTPSLPTQESTPMEEKDVKQDAVVATPPPQDAAQLLEFQARLTAMEAENASMKTENAKLAQTLKSEQDRNLANERKQEQREIELFCKELTAREITTDDGKRFKVAPAVVTDDLKQALLTLNHLSVLEFASGNKQTLREYVQGMMSGLIEMAAKGSLLVPLGQEVTQTSPIAAPRVVNFAAIQQQQQELIKKHMEFVRLEQPNATANYLRQEATLRAMDENPSLFRD